MADFSPKSFINGETRNELRVVYQVIFILLVSWEMH